MQKMNLRSIWNIRKIFLRDIFAFSTKHGMSPGLAVFFFNSSDKKSIFRKGENRENYELKAYRAIVLRSLINKPIFLVVAFSQIFPRLLL